MTEYRVTTQRQWIRPRPAAAAGSLAYVQMIATAYTITAGVNAPIIYVDPADPPVADYPIQRDPAGLRSTTTLDGFGTDDIAIASAVVFDATYAGAWLCTTTFVIRASSGFDYDAWTSMFGYHHRNVAGTEDVVRQAETFIKSQLLDPIVTDAPGGTPIGVVDDERVDDETDDLVGVVVNNIYVFEDGDYFWTSALGDAGVVISDVGVDAITTLVRIAAVPVEGS